MSDSQPYYSNLGFMTPLYVQFAKYCIFAASVIPIFDWLLCFDRDVRLVWNWHSGVTGASLVYVFSRYAMLIQSIVNLATNVPMSDMSCVAVVWTQNATGILGTISFGAFSALRVYALSNGKKWLAIAMVLFGLPPIMIRIMQGIDSNEFMNLPAPFNCISVVPPIETIGYLSLLIILLVLFSRASQLVAELFVVVITWRHAYQSTYQLRKHGIKVGTSLSSVLVYNGSIYFLFLGSLYIIDIIVTTKSLSFGAGSLLAIFYDPITSVIVCHFMLSLRQFDRARVADSASAAYSVHVSRIRVQELERTAAESTAHQSAPESRAGDSTRLPAFISSFAQPVNLYPSDTSGDNLDTLVESDAVERTSRRKTSS